MLRGLEEVRQAPAHARAGQARNVIIIASVGHGLESGLYSDSVRVAVRRRVLDARMDESAAGSVFKTLVVQAKKAQNNAPTA